MNWDAIGAVGELAGALIGGAVGAAAASSSTTYITTAHRRGTREPISAARSPTSPRVHHRDTDILGTVN